MTPLVELVARHKSGQPAGIYSLCSAHPLVIESALHEARASGTPLLVEATSNQVNQFGGYTGLTPAGFRAFVHDIAGRVGYPADRVWFGGDHLGPNAWRQETAATAMGHAEELVAQFVAAGFRKLHLDCSMSCIDDPSPLPEATVASRAARLCAAAERGWREHGGDAPACVIGTEVPVPGGAGAEELLASPSRPGGGAGDDRGAPCAFEAADLAAAGRAAVALVVQPGSSSITTRSSTTAPERREAERLSRGHRSSSTRRIPPTTRRRRTFRRWCATISPSSGRAGRDLRRETLWALAAIERELPGAAAGPGLREVVTAVMRADTRHWRGYYHDPATESFDLSYSLSDRIRYYWPHADVQRACASMLETLRRRPIPLTLMSQYLPRQYAAVRSGQLAPSVDALLRDGVAAALRPYIRACGA
jgi:D-tagatose-1,6-bisphosphate aldolase subunit GatZ/KbaZ